MINEKDIAIDIALNILIKFRNELYDTFPCRADAVMNLIDALTSNTEATSPVALSLNPLFLRKYGSVHNAIQNFAPNNPVDVHNLEINRIRCMITGIPTPRSRLFYLLGFDTTNYPRLHAHTLEDRGIQYYPNPAPGNKPITAGHCYSFAALLPEKNSPLTPPWVIPLSMRRVPTDKKGIEIAVEQMNDLLADQNLPFQSSLTGVVGDSAYSSPKFINPMDNHPNLVNIVKVRGNRKFYRTGEKENTVRSKGHPEWYGEKFHLGNPSTWGSADASVEYPITFKNGRQASAKIESWQNLLMSGKRGLPMHHIPFTLVRIFVSDASGKPVFKRALWLIVTGMRRNELSVQQVYDSYRQRYDLEHFFRFGKQKLLLTSYQTPDVNNEENWCQIVLLAYFQLYLMAPLAQALPRPWEKYLPNFKSPADFSIASPSIVLRDAQRILTVVGTPAKPPIQRGTSAGRAKGCVQIKRTKFPIIFKNKKSKSARSP